MGFRNYLFESIEKFSQRHIGIIYRWWNTHSETRTTTQKEQIIQAWNNVAGTLAMETFYAIGLKTHMRCDITNDANGDVFELSFTKTSK